MHPFVLSVCFAVILPLSLFAQSSADAPVPTPLPAGEVGAPPRLLDSDAARGAVLASSSCGHGLCPRLKTAALVGAAAGAGLMIVGDGMLCDGSNCADVVMRDALWGGLFGAGIGAAIAAGLCRLAPSRHHGAHCTVPGGMASFMIASRRAARLGVTMRF